jgi:hypothetical protein
MMISLRFDDLNHTPFRDCAAGEHQEQITRIVFGDFADSTKGRSRGGRTFVRAIRWSVAPPSRSRPFRRPVDKVMRYETAF